MKACFKCGRTLSLSAFYRHPNMADGHLGKCKACAKRDVHLNRLANLDRYRAYDRERQALPHRIAASAEYARAFTRRHPEKRAAHIAVGNAIRDGRLTRQACEVCGNPQTHGHHDDYSKPLTVRWLCAVHHAEHHHRKQSA